MRLQHDRIPDRNTIWHYQQRLGVDGVTALFQAVDSQLLQRGYIARCGQIIDATLVPAPIQHFTKEDKAQLEQGNIPSDWNEAKRRQKDLYATHTKKHGKASNCHRPLLFRVVGYLPGPSAQAAIKHCLRAGVAQASMEETVKHANAGVQGENAVGTMGIRTPA